MLNKLHMKSMNITQENIEKIRGLFPNAVTEVIKDGQVELAVDFDVLKQELSDTVIEAGQERYQMTWPDKRKAVALASSSISATLRPYRDDSVDFDTTQNLYLEGDNLDVLKLLRETYLGKVKMIYIDPPYNTGNDFVYEDDFAQSAEEYAGQSGQYDEQGKRLVQNTESNGRFHTDWLNMIYPRLKLARDLLSDDGVIFISIDDNEQANLKKVCDEIFGERNFIVEFIWKCRNSLQHDEPLVSKQTERILLYTKDYSLWNNENGISFNRVRKPYDATEYRNPDNDPRGPWLSSGKTRNDGRPSYTVISPAGVSFTKPWIPSPQEFARWDKEGLIWWGKDGKAIPRKKSFLKDFKGNAISDILFDEYTDEVIDENKIKRTKRWEIGTTESGTKGIKELFDGKVFFDYPKPWMLIKYLITIATQRDSIILDFFSGSATTAHAVMQLNAEDGGKRKFIMVQLPEKCDEKSEAYKAGYKTICEIGKERIRRAGKKIKEETGKTDLDTGFRVLKLDSSNMQDVFYNPAAMSQTLLDQTIDNVKTDRTPMDLLFQIMLELGVQLSAKIEEKEISGKKYYIVNENEIIACFDDNLNNDVITDIAKRQPIYAAFKSASFATDSASINCEQLFKTYSPATDVKVI